MSKNPDRILYDNWINSPLSVARFYGGCVYNGDKYNLDYENCRSYISEDGEELFFPDLVKVKDAKS